MRTIKVTGKGNVSVAPDLIQANITISGTKPEYENAIEESTKNSALLKEAIARTGLDPDTLKTVKFNISPAYERYQTPKGEWKQKFIGYRFTHQFVIKFDNDNKILGKVLYELAHCGDNATFTISYTVKDIEAVKAELLRAAVADSKRKAEAIACAAKVGLKEIEQIDYSWGEVYIHSNPIGLPPFDLEGSRQMAKKSRSYDIDIEADDIHVSDTVTIIWSIQ